MCIGASDWTSSAFHFSIRTPRSKRYRVRIHALNRRKRSEEKDIELKNLKLYMENITIFEENEKLRKKARLLHQENLTLMSEFQKKLSQFDCNVVSTTLHASTSSPPPFMHQLLHDQ